MPSDPHFAYVCNRRAWRFRPGHAEKASVSFHLGDGTHWRLGLVEISAGGIAFCLPDDNPALDVGTVIVFLEVQVGDIRVTGDVRVTHVTEEFAVGRICGGEFIVSTRADQRVMALLLADLEKRTPRTI